ncbi:uncharacterized protein V2V93DRAFT_374381 [Kockiozyma suomiensis]|uniref:uncharacterized protein n=1 Tax=Kockiozyma suomiensis TaxID=1337062 RepID=UPI003343B37B
MSVTSARPLLLLTVNTAPERARRLIPRVLDNLKDRYSIVHAANVARISDVEAVVEAVQPDVVCCASMWSKEEVAEIHAIAKKLVPNVKTTFIPHGLQVEKGPDAVVEFLTEEFPKLLDA